MSVIEKILSYHAEFVRKQTTLATPNDKATEDDLQILTSLENEIVPGFETDITKTLQFSSPEYDVLEDPDGSDEEIFELTTPMMAKKAKKFAYAKQGKKNAQPSPDLNQAVKSTENFTPSSPFSELHSIMNQNRAPDKVSPLEFPSPVLSSRHLPDSDSENHSVTRMFRKPFLKPRIVSLKQRLGFDEQDEKIKKLLAVKKLKKNKKKSKSFRQSLYFKNVRMGWFEPVLEDIVEENEECYVDTDLEHYAEPLETSESSVECTVSEKTDNMIEPTDLQCNASSDNSVSDVSEEISELTNSDTHENELTEEDNHVGDIGAVSPEVTSEVCRIEISSNEAPSPNIASSSTRPTTLKRPDLNELRKPQPVEHDFLDPVILVNNRQSLRRARDHLKLRIEKEVPRKGVRRNKKFRRRVKSGIEQVAGVFSKPKNNQNIETRSSQRSLFSIDLISKATIHTKNTLSSLVGYTTEEKLI